MKHVADAQYCRRWVLRFIACLAAMPLAHAPALADEIVLYAKDGYEVAAEISGVPLRLKVALDEGEGIALNPSAAARAGLGRGDGKWVQTIGPVKLRGRSADAQLSIAGRKVRTMVRWFERDVAEGADGTITPHRLPFQSVTFRRHPPRAGEREFLFETRFHHNHGIHFPLRLGDQQIAVRFSIARPRSMAPAAAAAVLALHQGGALEEATTWEEIHAGVTRPVQALRLERPLAVGGFLVPKLMARTADWRGRHMLPPTIASASESEIVVRGVKPSQEALYRITLGLDVLERCSAATYSPRSGRLVFRCV